MKKIGLPKRISHNTALMIVGVLALGVVGFTGYNVYKEKNSDSASATTVNLLVNKNGSVLTVCKLTETKYRFRLDNTASSETRYFGYRIGYASTNRGEWVAPRTNLYRYLDVGTNGTVPYGFIVIGGVTYSGSISTPWNLKFC